jgi:hypothetical protein
VETFNVIVYKQMIIKLDFVKLNVVILLFQGLIVASTLFGMATSAIKDQGKVFYNFFTSATHVILQMLRWLIW